MAFINIQLIVAIKHLNNLLEQERKHVKHRFTKSTGFQKLRHTSRTIKGIETIHALYKKSAVYSPTALF